MASLRLGRWHFLLFALIYVYAFPYFDRLRSAQEMPRVLLTQEIVDEGRFYLDRRRPEMVSTNDLSVGPDHHFYANKTAGPSFVAIPVYVVCKIFGLNSVRATTWAFRVGAITIPALLFLILFYRLIPRFTDDVRAQNAALAAYSIASPVLPYSLLFYSHMLAAVCLGVAFYLCVKLSRTEPARPWLVALGAGLVGGLAPMMDYQAALGLAILGVYLLARTRRPFVYAGIFSAGAIPGLATLAAYNTICFGAPWRISYGFGLDTAPEKGFLGFIGPNKESFWNVLLAPSNGLLILAPWVVLAIVGYVHISNDPRKRNEVGPEAAVCAGVIAAYVLFLGSMLPYMARGGWSAGPRQLVGCLPFVGWLAAAGFEVAGKRFVTRVLAFGSVIAGGVIFLAAATSYPHWPDGLANPLFELSFPLIWKGYAVNSLGTLIGLRGIWATLPLYLLAAGMVIWLLGRGWRQQAATLALATVLGVTLVASYRLFPLTGKYSWNAWSYITTTWEPTR